MINKLVLRCSSNRKSLKAYWNDDLASLSERKKPSFTIWKDAEGLAVKAMKSISYMIRDTLNITFARSKIYECFKPQNVVIWPYHSELSASLLSARERQTVWYGVMMMARLRYPACCANVRPTPITLVCWMISKMKCSQYKYSSM